MPRTPKSNFRISNESVRLVGELAGSLGISQTAAVEVALRKAVHAERPSRKMLRDIERDRSASSPMQPTAFRLSPPGLELLDGLANRYRLTRPETVEAAIRLLAEDTEA